MCVSVCVCVSGRIKLIKLQVTLLHALESHALSQRQWKGSPVYKLQVTCLSVYKSDSHSGSSP